MKRMKPHANLRVLQSGFVRTIVAERQLARVAAAEGRWHGCSRRRGETG